MKQNNITLTDLILSLNNNEKHDIRDKLNYHMLSLTLDFENNIKMKMQIHSQYNSLLHQLYKPYNNNSLNENIIIAMEKVYDKLKNDYNIKR